MLSTLHSTRQSAGNAAQRQGTVADPVPTLIAFDQVSKRFVSDGHVHPAIDNVSLEVRRGEIFGVIGRSGAGKSTLLRMINRLEAPTSGAVVVAGQCLEALDDKALVALRRRTGMIFQHFNLLTAKTALNNVALPLQAAGTPRAQALAKAEELLELVGLGDKLHAYPSQLSGGQKQRVAIARALVHEPDVLLCDEATSALDQASTEAILSLLQWIRKTLKVTIVLITHQLEVVQAICDRVAVMEHGRITAVGSTWEILGRSPALSSMAQAATLAMHDRKRKLLSLHFDGRDHASVDLAAISAAAPGAQLVHGGVQHVQGRSVGTLLLSIADTAALPTVLERLRQITPFVEVQTHVAADAG